MREGEFILSGGREEGETDMLRPATSFDISESGTGQTHTHTHIQRDTVISNTSGSGKPDTLMAKS
jgi:hypothetical protein